MNDTDLRTRYLGLDLPHPVVASASPLTRSVDGICRLAEVTALTLAAGPGCFCRIVERRIAQGGIVLFVFMDHSGKNR